MMTVSLCSCICRRPCRRFRRRRRRLRNPRASVIKFRPAARHCRRRVVFHMCRRRGGGVRGRGTARGAIDNSRRCRGAPLALRRPGRSAPCAFRGRPSGTIAEAGAEPGGLRERLRIAAGQRLDGRGRRRPRGNYGDGFSFFPLFFFCFRPLFCFSPSKLSFSFSPLVKRRPAPSLLPRPPYTIHPRDRGNRNVQPAPAMRQDDPPKNGRNTP